MQNKTAVYDGLVLGIVYSIQSFTGERTIIKYVPLKAASHVDEFEVVVRVLDTIRGHMIPEQWCQMLARYIGTMLHTKGINKYHADVIYHGICSYLGDIEVDVEAAANLVADALLHGELDDYTVLFARGLTWTMQKKVQGPLLEYREGIWQAQFGLKTWATMCREDADAWVLAQCRELPS